MLHLSEAFGFVGCTGSTYMKDKIYRITGVLSFDVRHVLSSDLVKHVHNRK